MLQTADRPEISFEAFEILLDMIYGKKERFHLASAGSYSYKTDLCVGLLNITVYKQ